MKKLVNLKVSTGIAAKLVKMISEDKNIDPVEQLINVINTNSDAILSVALNSIDDNYLQSLPKVGESYIMQTRSYNNKEGKHPFTLCKVVSLDSFARKPIKVSFTHLSKEENLDMSVSYSSESLTLDEWNTYSLRTEVALKYKEWFTAPDTDEQE